MLLVSAVSPNEEKGSLFTIDSSSGHQIPTHSVIEDCPVHENAIAFSSSFYVVLCKNISTFHVFSYEKESPLSKFYGHEKLSCLQTVQEFTVAGAVNGNILVWETLSGELLQIITNSHFQAVTKICSQGPLFMSAGRDGLVKCWNIYQVISGECPESLFSLSDHQSPITNVQFLLSGRCVTSADGDKNVYLYEEDGSLLARFSFPQPIKFFQMNSIETLLFAASTDSIYIIDFERDQATIQFEVWTGTTIKVSDSFQIDSPIRSLAFNFGEDILIVGTFKDLQFWDVESKVLMKRTTPIGNLQITGIYNIPVDKIPLSKGLKLTPFKKQFSTDNRILKHIEERIEGREDNTEKNQELREEIARLKQINASLVEFMTKKAMIG